jgi:hypothetical protein
MAREGVFMKIWFGAAAVWLVACPAFAAEVATCTLSADKKTVTVTASNPYSQVMACEVNCHMGLPGGFATVVCVKPVPVGSKDFVCAPASRAMAIPIRRSRTPRPTAPIQPRRRRPPASPTPKEKAIDDDDDDDDDDKPDQKMQKMMKQKPR